MDHHAETKEAHSADGAPPTAPRGATSVPLAPLPPELEPDSLPGALFGYDRYTIVKLLDSLRERFQALARDRAERDARIKDLELQLLRSQENQRLIGETLLAARQEAQAVRENARREAQGLLRAARKRAQRMCREAEREATARARELVETAERERRALVDEAGRAKAFIEETHEQLSDFLMAAVRWYEQAKLSRDEGSFEAGEPAVTAQAGAPPPGAEASTEPVAPSGGDTRAANEHSSIPSA